MKKFLISLIAAVMFILGASQIISACNGIHDNNANASDSQVSSMSEEEYKKSCKEISWKDLCRNPDNYKGDLVKVQVKIQQIFQKKYGALILTAIQIICIWTMNTTLQIKGNLEIQRF